MSWLTRDIWLIWLHTLYLAILNNLPVYDILRIWFIKQYEMQNDCLHGIFDHVGSSYYEQNRFLQMILLVAWSRICRLIMCQHQILSKKRYIDQIDSNLTLASLQYLLEELTPRWREPWWRCQGQTRKQRCRWQRRASSQNTSTRSLSQASRSDQIRILENAYINREKAKEENCTDLTTTLCKEENGAIGRRKTVALMSKVLSRVNIRGEKKDCFICFWK